MFIELFATDLFCAGIFKIYHINRPQDYTVATEVFFLRRKFVIEEVECSVILKYKSNSLTKHTDSTVRCL